MYDIKWIREHPEAFDKGLKRRGLEPLSASLLKLDETRRALITKLEQAQARRNSASKEIGQAKAKKDEATAQKLMAEVGALKTLIPAMEAEEKEASAALEKELAQIPNTPLDDVPDGTSADDNVEYRRHGKKRDYAFKPKQHFELGEALGMMDFELAAKLSGARFVVLQNGLARMERALGQFMLDLHTGTHGYTEVNPPILVRDDVMYGTAQLPKFAEDQFSVSKLMTYDDWREFSDQSQDDWWEPTGPSTKTPHGTTETPVRLNANGIRALDEFQSKDRRWLIPTAEVPLTNLVRESIVAEDQLPMRLTALTPCFRAEAGAAGKDTRGMIRQHQFTKVELVSITTPEKSKDEHERMLSCAEAVLKQLDLHYRVVTLCTGDMGFAAQKTYDIEVWLPGQNMYREISSCSVCGDFQARRMNARYRPKGPIHTIVPGMPGGAPIGAGPMKVGPSPRHVHTLNGSGVAVGRALIAVMENYQEADGSILVPAALKPYMGGVTKIEKAA